MRIEEEEKCSEYIARDFCFFFILNQSVFYRFNWVHWFNLKLTNLNRVYRIYNVIGLIL